MSEPDVYKQSIPCPMCGRPVVREVEWRGPFSMNARLLTKGGKQHRCPVARKRMAEQYAGDTGDKT